MRRFTKSLLAALAIASLVLSPAAFAGNGAVDTSALSQPVKEVRDTIPYGKDDLRFGKVTETPKDILIPPSTPLHVRLLATKAPRVNEAINVTLEAYAAYDAPGTTLELKVPQGTTLLGGSLKGQVNLRKGETTRLTASIVFKKEGEYAIHGVALRPVSADEVWGDDDSLFFTVGSTSGMVGLASAGQQQLPAGQISKGGLSLEADTEEPAVAGLDANINVSICWNFQYRGTLAQTPLRNALLKLYDDDTGTDDLLWSGYTPSTGCRTVTVSNLDADEGGYVDPFFQVWLEHSGMYRVRTYGGGGYYAQTSTAWNVSANYNFGSWIIYASGNGRATWIYDDLYRLRRFIDERGNTGTGMGGDPGYIQVRWETGGTDGTYYRLSDGLVHLKDADCNSRDTVVHEASHRIMHVVYGGWTSGSDCPSPHYIQYASGKYCGWSEGWTYVNVAAADGNPSYTWPSGSSLNLETPNCASSGWDDGARVEGRVGGVLIDLLDPFTLSFDTVSGFSNEGWVAACGGEDQMMGMYDAIWDLFFDQNDDVFVTLDGVTNSFSNAWEGRGLPRYGPHRIGHLNSIDSFTHD